jgi:hypothetical protein
MLQLVEPVKVAASEWVAVAVLNLAVVPAVR